jgi:3-methylfumaryl-CoA hydratase
MTTPEVSTTIDLSDYEGVIGGRVLEASDQIVLRPAEIFRGTFWPHLEPLSEGQPLPAGLHCLYHLPLLPKAALRPDGTPLDNGLVPPIPLPRRMFASEEVEFLRPIHIGETLIRRSQLDGIRQRVGTSGPLVFATVRHEIPGALRCWQQTVFRGAGGETPPRRSEDAGLPPATWREDRQVDAVALFRFSALTSNSHRVHYDQRWARDVEGYPQLVVHGQLISLLLMERGLAWVGVSQPRRYRMRAQAPSFCGEALELCGVPTEKGCRLWALSSSRVVMQAELDVD